MPAHSFHRPSSGSRQATLFNDEPTISHRDQERVAAPRHGASPTRTTTRDPAPTPRRATPQNGLRPTDEQQRVIEAQHDGSWRGGGKLIALAGTGKTTTLRLIGENRRGRGLYVAFNKAIQMEAEAKFPRHVTTRTAHSLAFGARRMFNSKHKLQGKLFADRVAEDILELPNTQGGMPREVWAAMVQDTITQYCQSSSRTITEDHVPLDAERDGDQVDRMIAHAERLWRVLTDRNNRVPMTHDVYLKEWQLDNPRLNYDYILFDEAQDASPVMTAIIQQSGVPTIYVGDPWQEIYAWRGAQSALDTIDLPTDYLTQSFRFDPNVANAANWVLRWGPRQPDKLLRGIDPPPPLTGYMRLSRTNSAIFNDAAHYVMDNPRTTLHVVGGLQETIRLVEAAYTLYCGRRPAKVPEIGRFTSWGAMQEWSERFEDQELKFLINTVETHNDDIPEIKQRMMAAHVDTEDQAELRYSTAHKAKGREWHRVTMTDDFTSPANESKWTSMSTPDRQAEINLLYVTVTRGQKTKMPQKMLAALKGFVATIRQHEALRREVGGQENAPPAPAKAPEADAEPVRP
jgi:hypothetical protein